MGAPGHAHSDLFSSRATFLKAIFETVFRENVAKWSFSSLKIQQYSKSNSKLCIKKLFFVRGDASCRTFGGPNVFVIKTWAPSVPKKRGET